MIGTNLRNNTLIHNCQLWIFWYYYDFPWFNALHPLLSSLCIVVDASLPIHLITHLYGNECFTEGENNFLLSNDFNVSLFNVIHITIFLKLFMVSRAGSISSLVFKLKVDIFATFDLRWMEVGRATWEPSNPFIMKCKINQFSNLEFL